MDIIKPFFGLLPLDSDNSAGYGPFRLPDRCKWMQSIAQMHDHYYKIGPDLNMRLSDIDWKLFYGWALTIPQVEEDPMKRCRMARDICRYWPIARVVGHYMYGRHHEGGEAIA